MKRRIELFEGEEIKKRITPHPLAFYWLYLIWVYVIAVSLVFYYQSVSGDEDARSSFRGYALNLPQPPDEVAARPVPILNMINVILNLTVGWALGIAVEYGILLIWLIALIVPTILISYLRVSFTWIFLIAAVGAASALIAVALELPPHAAYLIAVALSVLGGFGVELYRRAHSYYLTNYRIVSDVRFITHTRDELNYDKINNVVLNTPLLGRLFNFGTIYPLTASGLGMGEDSVELTVGGAAAAGGRILGGAVSGGKSIQLPRSRTGYSLFGVPHPSETLRLISELMHKTQEAPYLREISKDIKKLAGDKDEEF